MFVRVEVAVKPDFADAGADRLIEKLKVSHPMIHRKLRWARLLPVHWLGTKASRSDLIQAINEIYRDPVLNWLFTGGLIPSAADKAGSLNDLLHAAPFRPGNFYVIEKRFRPGVTDNVARTSKEALSLLLGDGHEIQTASGEMFILEGSDLELSDIETIAEESFCNGLIESWTISNAEEIEKSGRFASDRIEREFPTVKLKGKMQVEEFALEDLGDADLEKLSQERMWALSLNEMKTIQNFFLSPKEKSRRSEYGLGKMTDVEMEVLAQTWSEHCKHKIFAASVSYSDHSDQKVDIIPSEIKEGLFKSTIYGTTRLLPRDWLLSVFSDNAGIVAFDENSAFCIKVETHNSPSALDPYGGALTGIVGVNRDILGCGLGARPLFNTDVFCVGYPDSTATLPDGLLHPRRILEGVRQGVEDGGNQSGIPTVNGALVFDDRYRGKPLVYCGTGGWLPREIGGRLTHEKNILSGDLICMVGGRIGKDGIHGATFSSLALEKGAPATVVQIGDPMTQKRMTDFLMEARDLGLYRALTDNGAGGLSSSVGEMALLSGGARLDVSLAKTKYPGLKPYELVISESQERMTLAVPTEYRDALTELAKRRGVEMSFLGEFNDSGNFDLFYGERLLGSLPLSFLHDGCPRMHLEATWSKKIAEVGKIQTSFVREGKENLLGLLSRPNVASKEWLIRQYDHEVQATSVIKPLHSTSVGTSKEKSGPNDGGVIRPDSKSLSGIAIGCGINSKLSDIDPYLMGLSVVDEAVRNVVSVGVEYGNLDSVLALCDNFCWPDPTEDTEQMGALVRACYGMKEAALALQTPFVSGKDSMKNNFKGMDQGKPVEIAVPPTLLITAVGRVKNISECRTSDFKQAGDRIYLFGPGAFGLLGSEFHFWKAELLKKRGASVDQVVLPMTWEAHNSHQAGWPDWEIARKVYTWLSGETGEKGKHLKSVHDISEGGLLTAVSESLFARGFGADIEIPEDEDPWVFSFGEGFHSFIVSIGKGETKEVEEEWEALEIPFLKLGEVNESSQLFVKWNGDEDTGSFSVMTSDLNKAWKGAFA